MKRLKKAPTRSKIQPTALKCGEIRKQMVAVIKFLRFQIKDHRTGDSLQACESQSGPQRSVENPLGRPMFATALSEAYSNPVNIKVLAD
jgi:hypothetical protein